MTELTEIRGQLRKMRDRARALDRYAQRLESLVVASWIASKESEPSSQARPTRAILRLLESEREGKTKGEIVRLLVDQVDSRAHDRKRAIYATVGYMVRRGVLQEREGRVCIA